MHGVRYCFWTVVLGTLVGCSAAPTAPEIDPGENNLYLIGQAYAKATQELKHAPNSVEELRPFLKELGEPDSILRSPHDGELYVILWGVRNIHTDEGTGGAPVLAYERKGKDGKRQVLLGIDEVEVMTEEEFKNAPFPKGHKPVGG